jgi:hypothetical protein
MVRVPLLPIGFAYNCSVGESGLLKTLPSGPITAELPGTGDPMIGHPAVFMISTPASEKALVQWSTKDCDSIAYD